MHYAQFPNKSPVDKIPPSIVKAICRVQSGIAAVKQDGKNQHGNYKYASTDAVYAALALKLADAGLAIIPLEDEEPEIKRIESKDGKPQQWGKFAFRFVLATEEDTWDDPRSRRCLYIQITGPQTFMAAQSYAEKAYLRSLFKLPTGDMDLDAVPQEKADHEGEAPKRKSSAAAKRDGWSEKFNETVAAIQSAPTLDALQTIYMDHADHKGGWSEWPTRWAELLGNEYDARYEDLRDAEAAYT